ncbi:hypothetical protein ApAK_02485 [Thermoplasmatales archaeon AK]|nr:hypothetical protein [Thermoplasmatales archaeon AK]
MNFLTKDSAVAEVIGTILIFAVVITLVTSFLAWYIPVQQAHFETEYLQNTEEAFMSLAGSLHSDQQFTSLSATFPMGIGGTPPITQPAGTELSLSPNLTLASISSKVTVSLKNSTNVMSRYNIIINASVSGQIESLASLQYVADSSYVMQDGSVIAVSGSNNSNLFLGPLPISITDSSGNISLGALISGIQGPPSVISSENPIQLTFLNVFKEYQIINGSISSLNNSIAVVSLIMLSQFNYTITSKYASSWDLGLYRAYNGSTVPEGSILSQGSWFFKGLPFKVTYSGYTLKVTLDASPLDLAEFTYYFSAVRLQQT